MCHLLYDVNDNSNAVSFGDDSNIASFGDDSNIVSFDDNSNTVSFDDDSNVASFDDDFYNPKQRRSTVLQFPRKEKDSPGKIVEIQNFVNCLFENCRGQHLAP